MLGSLENKRYADCDIVAKLSPRSIVGITILIVAILLAYALNPAAETQIEKDLQRRPLLDDDVFIETYYADGRIPRQIPIRLRQVLAKMLGRDWAKALPNDNAVLAYDEIDPWDIFQGACRAFGVPITLEEAKQLDGTFDSIVRFLAARTTSTKNVP